MSGTGPGVGDRHDPALVERLDTNPNVVQKGPAWWCTIHRAFTGFRGWCPYCAREHAASDREASDG